MAPVADGASGLRPKSSDLKKPSICAGTTLHTVSRILTALDWRPQFNDLDTIVGHALAWERRLAAKRPAGAG